RRGLGGDLDRALEPTAVGASESTARVEVAAGARQAREPAFGEADVGAAVAFVAAAGVERVGDHARAELAAGPGEAAVAALAREPEAERRAAGGDAGVAPGAGHGAGAAVVVD